MKTKLDLMLDALLDSPQQEITFDVRDYTEIDKARIIAEAEKRGLDASSDGKWILVRKI